MNDRVTASIVARFTEQDSGLGMSIEPDTEFYADFDIHLLLHPADFGIRLYATPNGATVVRGSVKPVPVRSGAVQFSGSAFTSLPKRPVFSNPQFDVQYAVNKQGQPISISPTYNSLTNVVSAGVECYAAVSYTSYISSALRLTYTPLRTTLGQGISIEFGVISAFKPPNSQLQYEVQPLVFNNGNAVVELYKKYSLVVSTQYGTFEYPPGYPNSTVVGGVPYPPGAFPGSTFTGYGFSSPGVLDISGGSMVSERPHETGFMDVHGRGHPFSENVEIREPYLGPRGWSINYMPDILSRVNTLDPDEYPMNIQLMALDFIKSRGLATGVNI